MNYSNKVEEIKGVQVFVGVDIGKEMHFMSLIAKDGEVIESGIRSKNKRSCW